MEEYTSEPEEKRARISFAFLASYCSTTPCQWTDQIALAITTFPVVSPHHRASAKPSSHYHQPSLPLHSYNTVFISVYIIHARVPFVSLSSSIRPSPIDLSIMLPAHPAPPPHSRYPTLTSVRHKRRQLKRSIALNPQTPSRKLLPQ